MPTRADVRPTRRAFLFAYLGPLFGSLLPRRRSIAAFTSLEGSDLERLLRWFCWRIAGLQFAGAS